MDFEYGKYLLTNPSISLSLSHSIRHVHDDIRIEGIDFKASTFSDHSHSLPLLRC